MSWIPQAGALWRKACEGTVAGMASVRAPVAEQYRKVRRPALRLIVALGLMAPAAGMMAVERHEAREQALASAAEAAEPVQDVANAAWTEDVLARERQYIARGFAKRFGIGEDLAQRIHTAALEQEISPTVAFGLVRAESTFRTRAVSPAGAVGLTQLLPSTARWISPGTTRSDLMDPETNLRVGFLYLRYLLDKYDGNESLALTAYNRGPGTVDRHLRQGRNPDNGYAEMVRTGSSKRHTALMNARFGGRRS